MQNQLLTVSTNPCRLIDFGVGNTLPSPETSGLGEGLRWEGSRVRLRLHILAMMAETRLCGAFNLPVNICGSLPAALVLSKQPTSSTEFIVTGTGTQTMGEVYPKNVFIDRKAKEQPCRVFHVREAVTGARTGRAAYQPITYWNRLTIPVDALEVVTVAKADASLPVPGVDYVEERGVIAQYHYDRLDRTCDGFSNKPTAVLALALKTDQALNTQVQGIRTKKGVVTEAGLMRLSKRHGWQGKFITQEDRYIDGFPHHFQSVDFAEIAEFFNNQ